MTALTSERWLVSPNGDIAYVRRGSTGGEIPGGKKQGAPAVALPIKTSQDDAGYWADKHRELSDEFKRTGSC